MERLSGSHACRGGKGQSYLELLVFRCRVDIFRWEFNICVKIDLVVECARVPTAQGKWPKEICQGKHREFGFFLPKHREFGLLKL